jgi:nicotinamidase-related amidase
MGRTGNHVSDPEKTALLFVECQRGVIGDLSVLPALAASARPVVATMGRLAAGARAARVQVAHLTYLPGVRGRTTNRRTPLLRATKATAEWDHEHPAAQVVAEIGVEQGDLVLPRHQGVSPVHRTEVLAVLRNLGLDQIVVAGVSTNLAVLLVAVGAADEDFAVTIPTDATVGTPPEYHEAVLAHSLAFVARLATTDELLAEWSAVTPPPSSS